MMMNDEAAPIMEMEKSWDKVPGHIAPATIYIIFGAYALFKTMKLAKEVPAGRTFTQTHIPFRDLSVVRNIGVAVMTSTVAGALYHSVGEGIDDAIRIHMTLYASFFLVGLVALLESQKRLMPDSGRAALALALILDGIVWRAHGLEMMVPVARNVHVYVGYINLIDGAVFAYSVMRNDSILAHIMSWALMVLQGLWLYVISAYLCCVELDHHYVEANLCGLAIALAIAIVVAIALAKLPSIRESHSTSLADGRGEYEVLMKCGLSGDSEATDDTHSHDGSDDDHC